MANLVSRASSGDESSPRLAVSWNRERPVTIMERAVRRCIELHRQGNVAHGLDKQDGPAGQAFQLEDKLLPPARATEVFSTMQVAAEAISRSSAKKEQTLQQLRRVIPAGQAKGGKFGIMECIGNGGLRVSSGSSRGYYAAPAGCPITDLKKRTALALFWALGEEDRQSLFPEVSEEN